MGKVFLCLVWNCIFFWGGDLFYALPYVNLKQASKYKVMIIKEGSTKIINLTTPGAGVLVLGHGHMGQIVRNALFLQKSSSLLFFFPEKSIYNVRCMCYIIKLRLFGLITYSV